MDWEFDPATNVWTKKPNPGIAGIAYTFSNATKGYALTTNNNLWEYDPSNDTWARRADFPGPVRNEGTAFSIGDNGYFGFGITDRELKNDFWEYIPPSANSITTKVVADSLCSGSTVEVSFTANGAFGTGNIFTAEMSDSAGNWSLPKILGRDSSAISGVIPVTIPGNLSYGQAYRIRVAASSPAVTGSDNGVNLVVNPAPVARAKDRTIYLDKRGIARLRPEDLDDGSLAYCGVLKPALDDTIFYCREIGLNTVKLTVTDGNGNIATDTAEVTVVDSMKPVIRDAFVLPNTLWPPDNKFRKVAVIYRADDNCCIASKSLSVTSNEPSRGKTRLVRPGRPPSVAEGGNR
ncbi:hypothetical protein ACQ86N_18190 [Puia sp. P3]|uniref:hypothetical protein n=1 Tax=Puia sp. P3 TaxID=3423952 RepID=UPI003D673DC4